MKCLILGDGLLGKELVKQTGWDYVSRKKDNMDLSDISTLVEITKRYDTIINCIGNTDTYSDDSEQHLKTNFDFVVDLVEACNDTRKRYIHISTDFVYSNSKPNSSETDVPVHLGTWYGYSKLLADGYIQRCSKNYLVIRCGHKEEPFKYEKAWTTQKGNFDYTSVISKLIIKLIEDELVEGVYNVGTDVKSMYELASKTKKNVKTSTKLANKLTPKDVTMNVSKMKKILDK